MSVRVLIVEDDRITQRVLTQRLERIGCTVVGTADNAADAVASFRELHPDLITLDIQMPEVLGMDTMALFTVIRAEDLPTARSLLLPAPRSPPTASNSSRRGCSVFSRSRSISINSRPNCVSIIPN